MKNPDLSPQEYSTAELHSALFANLVIQQANMALMMLGKNPHPETGESIKDLEAARLFIDQLEMLAVKTKDNLTKEEQSLLNQTLTTVRLAYVEESGNQPQTPASAPPKKDSPPSDSTSAQASGEDDSKKKFVKRY